jgi:hypothetical protein
MIYFSDFVASSANLPVPDPLRRAQNQLNPGDILFSATSNFQLIFQTDGNLVLYCILTIIHFRATYRRPARVIPADMGVLDHGKGAPLDALCRLTVTL